MMLNALKDLPLDVRQPLQRLRRSLPVPRQHGGEFPLCENQRVPGLSHGPSKRMVWKMEKTTNYGWFRGTPISGTLHIVIVIRSMRFGKTMTDVGATKVKYHTSDLT